MSQTQRKKKNETDSTSTNKKNSVSIFFALLVASIITYIFLFISE